EIAVNGADRSTPAFTSGLVGSVRIFPAASAEVALVPAEAVVEADGGSGVVFTLAPDGQHAQRRTVARAVLSGDRVGIASGLEGAQTVIVDGAANLDDGKVVEVRP